MMLLRLKSPTAIRLKHVSRLKISRSIELHRTLFRHGCFPPHPMAARLPCGILGIQIASDLLVHKVPIFTGDCPFPWPQHRDSYPEHWGPLTPIGWYSVDAIWYKRFNTSKMYFQPGIRPLEMQQATHPRLHVRDARDAHIVFEAVRQGFLRPVTRRLNEMERSMYVRSGALFVWEECDDESGLKRWTDGRVWGQSRMREPYLFYDEKLPSDNHSNQEPTNRSPVFRFVDGSRNAHSSSALLHQDRSGGQHSGLVKQAYSAWVTLSPTSRPRKWHLTAYFTYADLPSIPTVDHDPVLSKIIVPAGIYRGGKARSRIDSESGTPVPDFLTGGTGGQMLLPPLHSTIGSSHSGPPYSPRTPLPQPTAFSEDRRVIQMLNSKYVP